MKLYPLEGRRRGGEMNQRQVLMGAALVAALTLFAIGISPVAGVVMLTMVVIGGAAVLLVLPEIRFQRRHFVWLALVIGSLLLLAFYFGALPSQADPGLRGWLLVAVAGLALVAVAYAPARRPIGRWAAILAIIAAIVFLLGGRQQVSEQAKWLAEWRPRPTATATMAAEEPKEVKLILASDGKASFDLGAWVAKNPRHRFGEVFAPETVQITYPDGSSSGYRGGGVVHFSGPPNEIVRLVLHASRPGKN